MSQLPHATAAKRDVTLADGNVYRLAPLDLQDWGEIDAWLETWVVERAKRIYAGAPSDIQAEGLRLAYARATRVSFANADGVKLLVTPEGTARVLWHALRHAKPELTLEDVKKLWDDAVGREIERVLEAANRVLDPTGAMGPHEETPQE